MAAAFQVSRLSDMTLIKRKQRYPAKQGSPAMAGPDPQKTLLIQAVQHLQAGHIDQAEMLYRQILAANPGHILALQHLAMIEHQLGRSEQAVELLQRCLALKPDYAEAHSDLAVILMAIGRDGEAIAACEKAIALKPRFAPAYSNLGILLKKSGRAAEAKQAFMRAAKLDPAIGDAQAGLAEILLGEGQADAALAASDRAIKRAPNLPAAYGSKGLALHYKGRFDEAVEAYRQALDLDPLHPILHTRLGNAYRSQGRLEAAITAHRDALTIDPNCADAYCNLAMARQSLGDFSGALKDYDRALTLRPDFLEVLAALGLLLNRLGRIEDSIAMLRRALAIDPACDFALANLGHVLKDERRYVEAGEVYKGLLALGTACPPGALYEYCNLRRHICDWDGLEKAEAQAIAALRKSGEPMPPFAALAMHCRPEDHLALARQFARGFTVADGEATAQAAATPRKSAARERLRIGYVSSDFFRHATAYLMAELIERHDRSRFEIIAYCFSPEDGSELRQRLKAGFDHFVEIGPLSHAEAAQRIRADGIDILVDLKGYTRNARSMIFAHRPAPVQVNYLGYPTTMGASFIDYIIADPFVAPMEHQPYFDEKIVHLAHCYQPNDRRRQIASRPASRAECGLPENAFVFCSLNSAYKITEPVFAIWMRLLEKQPGSVLWLLDSNPAANGNLQAEAQKRGIDPSRLIFAAQLPMEQHLARLRLADLFLDTLPVNAHTTASEALWAGLPVLSCAGDVFVGRVAGSLLHAVGLPELVTHSLADYEAMAMRLSNDRAALMALRERLARNRLTAPLFDIEAYTQQLEAAFAHMAHRQAQGQPPQPFAVATL